MGKGIKSMERLNSSRYSIGGDDDDGPRRLTTRPQTKNLFTNKLHYIQNEVMKSLYRHKDCIPFKEPVDPRKLKITNYYKFITNPMDLGCIRERLANRFYKNAKECLHDFHVMFCNCYLYNLPESLIVKQARELEMTLMRKLIDMPDEEEVIPPGVKYQSPPRTSCISTLDDDDTDEVDCESTFGGNDEDDQISRSETCFSGGDESVELRRPRRWSTRIPPTKSPVGLGVGKGLRSPEGMEKKQDGSSSSSEEEEESDSDDSEGQASDSDDNIALVGGVDGILVGSERESMEIKLKLAQSYDESKKRIRLQMKCIQDQLKILHQQLNALQEEERELTLARKKLNLPSSSKGSGKKVPTPSGGTRKKSIKTPSKRVTEGKGEAPQKRKRMDSPPKDLTSNNERPMTDKELEELKLKISQVSNDDDMEEIIGIFAIHKSNDDDDDDDIFSIKNLKALRPIGQWKVKSIAEKSAKDKEKPT